MPLFYTVDKTDIYLLTFPIRQGSLLINHFLVETKYTKETQSLYVEDNLMNLSNSDVFTICKLRIYFTKLCV